MRIAFLSDLHLAPGALNRCTTSPRDLGELLDTLERLADRVLLLGDAFDLLRPERWRGWRDQLDLLHQEHPALIARLLAMDAIHGNHDAPMRARGWPEERAFHHTEVGEVLALHGHQWDVWLKKIWGMEEGANFVAGWFERVGLDGVSKGMGAVPTLLERLQDRREATSPTASSPHPESIMKEDSTRDRRAVAGLLSHGWDVVIAGHTHGLGLYEIGQGLYINSGSHAHDHVDAAILDTSAKLAITWRDGAWSQLAARRHGAGASGWDVFTNQSGESEPSGWRSRLSEQQQEAFEELCK